MCWRLHFDQALPILWWVGDEMNSYQRLAFILQVIHSNFLLEGSLLECIFSVRAVKLPSLHRYVFTVWSRVSFSGHRFCSEELESSHSIRHRPRVNKFATNRSRILSIRFSQMGCTPKLTGTCHNFGRIACQKEC
jgi:hypothetical protein